MHRDIKHKNIFLSSISTRPKVKIADFGIACILSDEEVFVQDAGSLGYKAPEIIRMQPSDFKSDIWNLGCILYDLLCGEMPFLGTSIDQVNHRTLY